MVTLEWKVMKGGAMANASRLLAAYLAVGGDELKRQRTLELFRARLEGPFADFDFDEVTASKDLEGEALERLLASLDQLPMGGGQRLVVVREAQELPKAARNALADYLSAPNPDASLLLLADRLDKRSRLFKAIRALGAKAVIDCELPQRKALGGKVSDMARELGLLLDYEATRELIDRVGQDPMAISRTLRTIRELDPSASRLDLRFIEEHVSRVERPGPWVVADAVAARDARGALRALAAMGPDDAIAVFTLLTQRIRELIVAREQDPRVSPQELARIIDRVQPRRRHGRAGRPRQAWQVKNHMRDARRFSRAELLEALAGALECEMALKGSSDSANALVSWVLGICAPSESR